MSFIKFDGRHSNWVHPFLTMVLLFTAIILTTIFAHDYMVKDNEDYFPDTMLEKGWGPSRLNFHPWIAYLCFGYVFLMFLSRYLDCGSYIFYESMWCCNSALLMAGIGILTNRPLLVGASVAGVSCDQLIWYIDCLGYAIINKFPFGAAKYLIWPETTWSKKYLCTHHLWFMPLALYALGWHFPPGSFLLSCIFTSVSTGLCRYTTPKFWKDVYGGHTHYLNVNAGHEFWRDVKIPILHMFDKSSALIYLPFMFICVNTGLNGPAYLIINGLMGLMHEKAE